MGMQTRFRINVSYSKYPDVVKSSSTMQYTLFGISLNPNFASN